MNKRLRKAILRALSGLCINLSAGWFALAFITPNITAVSNTDDVLRLIYDVLFGILFLGLTVYIEFKLR